MRFSWGLHSTRHCIRSICRCTNRGASPNPWHMLFAARQLGKSFPLDSPNNLSCPVNGRTLHPQPHSSAQNPHWVSSHILRRLCIQYPHWCLCTTYSQPVPFHPDEIPGDTSRNQRILLPWLGTFQWHMFDSLFRLWTFGIVQVHTLYKWENLVHLRIDPLGIFCMLRR